MAETPDTASAGEFTEALPLAKVITAPYGNDDFDYCGVGVQVATAHHKQVRSIAGDVDQTVECSGAAAKLVAQHGSRATNGHNLNARSAYSRDAAKDFERMGLLIS